MVVSSACMMVAVMAQIVTMFRRRPGTATGAAAVLMPLVLFGRDRRRKAEQGGERAAMAGVDRGIGAHAGLHLPDVFVIAVEIDSHRHPLHHLDAVAGGVLPPLARELRPRARARRADASPEPVVGRSLHLCD